MEIDPIAREATDALKGSAADVQLPELPSVKSSRRRRSAFAAAGLGFAVTIAVVGVVALSGGTTEAPRPEASAAPAVTTGPQDTIVPTSEPQDTIVTRPPLPLAWMDPEFLFGVEYPGWWFRAEESLTPGHTDPFEILSVATFPLNSASGVCGPFPWQAVVDFPADGALITIRERIRNVDPGEVSARPAAFGPDLPPLTLPEGDCLDNTARGDIGVMRWFTFDDQGRVFELLVVIGTEPALDVAAETWAIADSLAFEARPPLDSAASLEGIFGGNVSVIDDGGGPVVCAGGVAMSLPPQCGGPFLDGLDWIDLPWAESAQGQTWAGMYIEVRHVDGRLQLVSPPVEQRATTPQESDFTPPCPAPAGGWVFTPGPGATEDDLDRAAEYVHAQPDVSGSWVYNLVDPPTEFTFEYVLVATFTGDLERHEAAIRELWTGPLCVAERPWQIKDLQDIVDDLATLNAADWPPAIFWPGSFGADTRAGVVDFNGLIVTLEAQAWFDERYGVGVVRTSSMLQPIAKPSTEG